MLFSVEDFIGCILFSYEFLSGVRKFRTTGSKFITNSRWLNERSVTATYTIKLTGIVPADGSAIKQYIAAVSDTAGKAVTDYKSFSYNSHTIRNNGEFVRADFVNRSVSTAKLTLADGSVVDVKVSYGDINENEVR